MIVYCISAVVTSIVRQMSRRPFVSEQAHPHPQIFSVIAKPRSLLASNNGNPSFSLFVALSRQEKLIAEDKAGDMEAELERLRKEVATAEQTAAKDQGMLIRAAEERMAVLDKVGREQS